MAVARNDPRTRFRGRFRECAALDRMVATTRAGQSQVLVVRGEPGIGKSALVEYLVGQASGFRIARAAGVESEMELAYAGLHQLCASMLDRLDRLPQPQRDALGTAFGLGTGEPPDRFLVGLAVLSLLAEVAEQQPLVCVVDDAHWLDQVSAQTVAFVARRILAERIALVFVVREPSSAHDFAGLPELMVGGLSDPDARALLDTVMIGPVDEQVRDRIVAETHGNPLALLELPRELTSAELAGGFGLPDMMPIASRIEQGFIRQLQPLTDETRRLLLTAASEPVGDAALLWRAAEQLGIGPAAATEAEASGLIELGTRVRFRHPLVRSAVLRAADGRDVYLVHRTLAEVTDPVLEPDRRAWHRAQAVGAGHDEAVAAELEQSAGRAQARGGIAAAAAFLERATQLTPDPARRGARALAAAQAKFVAAAPERALELLATAELCPLDTIQRAQLERLRARQMLALRIGTDATPLLVDAARRLDPLDPASARETYLEALGAVIFAGRLAPAEWGREAAEAVVAAAPGTGTRRTFDLLLEGLAARFIDGHGAAVPRFQRTLDSFVAEQDLDERDLTWLWWSPPVAPEVWDDDAWHQLSTCVLALAREGGALNTLPLALNYRASVHVHAGEFDAASALIDEADSIKEVTGLRPLVYTALELVAWQGREAAAIPLIELCIEAAAASGEGRGITLAEYARAVLFNGLGRYEDACAASQRACEHDDLGLHAWALTELVESSSRTGNHDLSVDAVERLEERTRAAGTDWALGIEARSRALVSEGDDAELLYRDAIKRLERTRIAVHLARAQLLYGEWLRRESRRAEAREQLRAAHARFSRIGADGFAERAGRELLATGETVRKRTVETRDELTAQETQIARLAGAGRTNPEIGAELFLSPRTVEWHLRKVYTKLGISSRRELRGFPGGTD